MLAVDFAYTERGKGTAVCFFSRPLISAIQCSVFIELEDMEDTALLSSLHIAITDVFMIFLCDLCILPLVF